MFLICNMATVRLDSQIVSRQVVAEGLKQTRCLGSFAVRWPLIITVRCVL